MRWMLQERCRCRIAIDWPQFDPSTSRETIRATMRDYLERTKVDRLVVLDAPHYPNWFADQVWSYDRMRGVIDAMADQNKFERIATYDIPQLGAQATVWRRLSAQPAASPG
jgi:hypothetical protein